MDILDNCESLNHLILSLYGEDTLKETRRFERARIKLKKHLADLTFLKRCRDHRILPKFTAFKHHLHGFRYERIF